MKDKQIILIILAVLVFSVISLLYMYSEMNQLKKDVGWIKNKIVESSYDNSILRVKNFINIRSSPKILEEENLYAKAFPGSLLRKHGCSNKNCDWVVVSFVIDGLNFYGHSYNKIIDSRTENAKITYEQYIRSSVNNSSIDLKNRDKMKETLNRLKVTVLGFHIKNESGNMTYNDAIKKYLRKIVPIKRIQEIKDKSVLDIYRSDLNINGFVKIKITSDKNVEIVFINPAGIEVWGQTFRIETINLENEGKLKRETN